MTNRNIIQHGAQMTGLEEEPKVEIHLDALKATLKKYQTGKPLALMAYSDFVLKFTSARQSGYRNE